MVGRRGNAMFERLKGMIERNRQLLDELDSAPGGSASEYEKPPHY